MPHRWLSALLALALLTGCGGAGADESTATPASASPPSTATPPRAATPTGTPVDRSATVGVAGVEPYGDVLVDAARLTLYVFTSDPDETSTCDETCAENWPPLLSAGAPVAADGTRSGLVATIERADGTRQVTYGGRPLYHYTGDSAPGDALGAGLGDRWYPISPDGELADGSPGAGDGGQEP